MKFLYILVVYLLTIINYCFGGVPSKPNLFILAIGIDNYKKPLPSFKSCEEDAIKFTNKFKSDYDKLFNDNKDQKKEVFSFFLSNKNANKDSIKKVFEFISKNSLPDDYFVFIYAGITGESKTGETFIVPFFDKEEDSISLILNNSVSISLNTLGKWANSIQCNNQLFVSESGNGQIFATNLITELFESNILITSQSKRNRIIITTKGMGMDDYQCQNRKRENGGPLCYLLLNVNNIFEIFNNQGKVEFEIMKTEIQCNPFNGEKIYSVIYKESDFSHLLSNKFQGRGIKVISNENEEMRNRNAETKNYAIFIGSNEYIDKTDWRNLTNPINDAQAIQTILKNKYNFEVKALYNMPLDSVLMGIIEYKKSVGINDNVLIFFAGHGYYDKDYSDCFIAFKDSKPLEEDFRRNTYLSMATLNRVLDNFPNKKIFAIFDICFGAYFDLNAKDLSLTDYKEVSFDISLDEFIKRKSEYTSRIYLASGKGEVPDYWTSSLNHSPFANKLISVLENESSFLTPGKIYKYLEGNITEPVLKQFGKHEAKSDFFMKVK